MQWEYVLSASDFGIKFDTQKVGHPFSKVKKVPIKYRRMQVALYNLQPVID